VAVRDVRGRETRAQPDPAHRNETHTQENFNRPRLGVMPAMRRTFLAAAAAVAVLTTVNRAQAVCLDDTAHYVKHGYYVNAMWPWPYVCPDRIAVNEPFCIMVNNGWRRENLLGAHYFNPNTNQLNAAGELRVRWIMTQEPPQRRNIFVERELNANVNSQRTAAVREYATKFTVDNQPPQVAETNLMSEGRPATIVDFTNTKFQQSMPTPVLPAAQSSSSTTAQ
jgi:hypothetical protein